MSKRKQHEYKETSPYKGCADCGFGPGASVHNPHVRDEDEQRAMDAKTTMFREGQARW